MVLNFDRENSILRDEQSRTVKICMICYKCILGGLMLIITSIQIGVIFILNQKDNSLAVLSDFIRNSTKNVRFAN